VTTKGEFEDRIAQIYASVAERYEYARCEDHVPALNEMGREGWHVVPGTRESRYDRKGDWIEDRWLMERRVP